MSMHYLVQLHWLCKIITLYLLIFRRTRSQTHWDKQRDSSQNRPHGSPAVQVYVHTHRTWCLPVGYYLEQTAIEMLSVQDRRQSARVSTQG